MVVVCQLWMVEVHVWIVEVHDLLVGPRIEQMNVVLIPMTTYGSPHRSIRVILVNYLITFRPVLSQALSR